MESELYSLVATFLRSIMVGIAASITVGPVAVLCIQRTLSKSRKSGLMSGLGVASADTLMALVAYFCYAVFASTIERYDVALRVIGGLFVVGVGVYIFTRNPAVQIRKNRAGHSSSWQDFISIFGLTIANFLMIIPYILAFFAMFKISTAGETHTSNIVHGVSVVLGFFVGAVAWWSSLACLISLFRSRFKPRHLLTINHVAGVLITLLGASAIITTLITLSQRWSSIL